MIDEIYFSVGSYHSHWRQRDQMRLVAQREARYYSTVVPMSNWQPVPVYNGAMVAQHWGQIGEAIGDIQPQPRILMTVQITPRTIPQDIISAHEQGARIAKVFARYTPRMEYGIADFSDPQFHKNLATAEDLGMSVAIHCELPCLDTRGYDMFSSERDFIPILADLVGAHPGLPVSVEHISNPEMLDFVRETAQDCPGMIIGGLTLHHATMTSGDFWDKKNREKSGLTNSYFYCRPVLQTNSNRVAVLEAMVSGEECFDFGPDSAYHSAEAKEGENPPAGIYFPPEIAIPTLVEVFEHSGDGWQERMEKFACRNGEKFYGLTPTDRRVRVVREDWQVPPEMDGTRPARAERTLHWRLAAA